MVEQLNRDAGYDPVHMGGLDKAATQEHGIDVLFAISQAERAPSCTGLRRLNSSD